jgi:hypothetical protein
MDGWMDGLPYRLTGRQYQKTQLILGIPKSGKPTNTRDRFQFIIELPDQADVCTKTLSLCIRHGVNGREYLDNNYS